MNKRQTDHMIDIPDLGDAEIFIVCASKFL